MHAKFPFHRRRKSPHTARHAFAVRAFTLPELLVTTTLSLLAVTALSTLTVQQIKLTDNQYTAAVLDRNVRKLSDLLRAEMGEACMLNTNVDPGTDENTSLTGIQDDPATTNTPCNPSVAVQCSTTAGSDLRLLIPTLNTENTATNNQITYNVVRYYISGVDLVRDGPSVSTAGNLQATSATAQRVATNVASLSTRVSSDCQSAEIAFRLRIPNSNTLTAEQTIRLSAGSSLLIN